jgi:hypothetical protein
MWWDHFKSMQRGRAITWDDFKQAFKSHHIPKCLMDRKMRELLALKQGSNTVYRYDQKFKPVSIWWASCRLMQRRWRGSVMG